MPAAAAGPVLESHQVAEEEGRRARSIASSVVAGRQSQAVPYCDHV